MKPLHLAAITLLVTAYFQTGLQAQDINTSSSVPDFSKPPIPTLNDSDTTIWKGDFQTGANLNQATLSNNWKAGGTNSMAVAGLFHGTTTYHKHHTMWINNLQFDYGFQKLQGGEGRKTLDKILIDTKLVENIKNNFSLFLSSNLVTQFARGYTYKKDAFGNDQPTYVSAFFSPAYLVQAIGFEYQPFKWFSLDFGLGGLRHTIVMDTTLYHNVPNNYGVSIGKNVRTQGVFQLTANMNKEVLKNLTIKIRYAALVDYQKPALKNAVHRTDFSLNAKVNKWISVSVTSILLYDIDQDADLQYNQMLGVGLLYTFTNRIFNPL